MHAISAGLITSNVRKLNGVINITAIFTMIPNCGPSGDGNMPCFRCVKKKLDCSFKRPNKLVDKGNTSIKCKKNKDHSDEGWGPR
jgi:hypothetical protein